MKPFLLPSILAGAALLTGCGASPTNEAPAHATSKSPATTTTPMKHPIAKSDAEWQQQLTPEQYQVLRQKGTERAFTGQYWNTKDAGTYKCAGCGEVLFVSDTKFDSGCGWPSFFQPANTNAIAEARDTTHGMVRTEVTCSK